MTTQNKTTLAKTKPDAENLCRRLTAIVGSSRPDLQALFKEIRSNPAGAEKLISKMEANVREIIANTAESANATNLETKKGKTVFSLANAARRVGMPETSFRRFLSDYSIAGDCSIDGQAAFSAAWCERFAKERGSLEMASAMKRTKGFEQDGHEVFESCRQRIQTGLAAAPAPKAAPDERTWHEKHKEKCERSHYFTNPEAAAFLSVKPETFTAAVKQYRMKPDGAWKGTPMFTEDFMRSLCARLGHENRQATLERMLAEAAGK